MLTQNVRVELSEETTISSDAYEAKITLELKKGTYDLKTIFSSSADINDLKEWGANFVHVSYLD